MKRLLILLILLMFPIRVWADLTGTEGLAIDLSSAGAGTDFTIAFDPTELFGNRTWGDASTDTIVWTFNRATGTDPTITFNSGSIALPALTLTTDLVVAEGGTGASTFTDGGPLLGSGAGAITVMAVLGDGEIIIGDGTTDPVALDVGSSTAITILGTIATGVWQGTAIADAYVLNNITIDLATLATTLTITDNENTAENNPIVFVAGADPDGGNLGLETDGTCYYTPSTGVITTTGFAGALTGNASTTTLAATVTYADNENTAENNAVVFLPGGDLDGGNLAPEVDGDFHYNPSTGTVTATEFVGGGSGLTLASTDLSDTAALLYETELDSFAELDTQIADKALINLADGGTFTGNIIANANLSIGNATTTAGVLTLLEDDDDGANFASFMVPALTANTVYTLPPDDGDNTEVLQTNGSGVLTWVANAGGGTSFFAEDGDTTEVEIDDAKEWKFVEGASIDIDWTDTSTGSDADPFDLTIKLVVADDESTDDDQEIVFTTDNATLESDGDFHYSPDTGMVTATEFAGGGASLTSIDAATGDSATAFFDAGTIEHEWGGLQADVSGYTGLIGITGADTTVEVDLLSELLTAMGDVTAFITDDDMPAAATDPDIDAAGEIGRDTDGANETGDSSLRGHDGSNQFLYSKKLKTINFTLIEPDQIDAYDLIPVWHNTSGMTFTIVEWKAWSDDDDVSFEIEELTDMTDFTAITQVDACEVATNGTSVFYGSDATITHAAIEHDHSLAIDFDGANDTPDYVQISITGWFNADVD